MQRWCLIKKKRGNQKASSLEFQLSWFWFLPHPEAALLKNQKAWKVCQNLFSGFLVACGEKMVMAAKLIPGRLMQRRWLLVPSFWCKACCSVVNSPKAIDFIWSLQRLTSACCHFRKIDDRLRKGERGRLVGGEERKLYRWMADLSSPSGSIWDWQGSPVQVQQFSVAMIQSSLGIPSSNCTRLLEPTGESQTHTGNSPPSFSLSFAPCISWSITHKRNLIELNAMTVIRRWFTVILM